MKRSSYPPQPSYLPFSTDMGVGDAGDHLAPGRSADYDWYRRGYQDAERGDPPRPPRNRTNRYEYMDGYALGRSGL